MERTPRSTSDDQSRDTEEGLDPGAYIGRGEELAAETIPGGVQRKDERIAGSATQSTGAGNRGAVPPEEAGWPEGHREAHHVTDDDIREAGLNR
ncbi:MAG: hypothetical protein QOH61_2504 [Chloroflexota bacterium]|jgi:hypothetical protein|nr:hypothetical protein [Chloroflexota bacterium]